MLSNTVRQRVDFIRSSTVQTSACLLANSQLLRFVRVYVWMRACMELSIAFLPEIRAVKNVCREHGPRITLRAMARLFLLLNEQGMKPCANRSDLWFTYVTYLDQTLS